jgi:2,4-dienoyl-CoA reductase-like NADH-dependent reductase (Old Yellow Enzyme family)
LTIPIFSQILIGIKIPNQRLEKPIMSDSTLFTPFKLINYTLKNRIGVAPMTRKSSPGDSIPRQDVLDFLVRRAENGAAIVYTEEPLP